MVAHWVPNVTTSLSFNIQDPPHRITPLMGPNKADSSRFGQTTVRLNRLIDAETVISRQESELARANSQMSALRSQVVTQGRTIQLIDQHQAEVLINLSVRNRTHEMDAQFQVVDGQLDKLSEDLEHAEGDKRTLREIKEKIKNDQQDVQDLREIFTAGESKYGHENFLRVRRTVSTAS